MKITKEYGNISINFTENFFIDTHNDWRQLWGKWNWISFTLIEIYAENDKWTGGLVFQMTLLGLGFRLRWNYDPSKLEKLLADSDEELNETE